MRSTCWIPAVLVLCALGGTAAGLEPYYGSQPMSGGGASYLDYSAPPCAAPAYGTAPGCCESTPSCCDHIWDGYCQERRCQKWCWPRAFRLQAGMGRM